MTYKKRLPLEGKLSSISETDEVEKSENDTSSTASAVPLPLKGKAKTLKTEVKADGKDK